ncbi:NUDIX domain-containing protein [bacterium]|nr:NUDIX domain-containing protein [bacterium]
MTHCAFCGGILRDENIEGRIRKLCGSCGCVNYQNPIPSIAAIITDNSGGLLLVKRSVEPGVGLWCLPGGFMELGETPEETVVREVLEETGLHVKPGAIFDACSRIGGYHGDVVIIAYPAEVLDGELNPGDDASDVEYFPIDQLPEIAFLSHARFIDKYFS